MCLSAKKKPLTVRAAVQRAVTFSPKGAGSFAQGLFHDPCHLFRMLRDLIFYIKSEVLTLAGADWEFTGPKGSPEKSDGLSEKTGRVRSFGKERRPWSDPEDNPGMGAGNLRLASAARSPIIRPGLAWALFCIPASGQGNPI
jgi:hypothetical protein